MNKTDRSESGILWKTAGKSMAEDQRREVREKVIGDILWSYVADKDKNRFKGAIMNKSQSGLCILTLAPIKVGSILRIHVEGRGAEIYANVLWCEKGSADIYKSGLFLGE